MAPVRPKQRPSDQSTASTRHGATEGSTRVPLKGGPSTPHPRSPIRRRRTGISVQQKQALIDNLQLEVTERARRLRAQYNLQAQGLRSRIEIRVNRIPTSLRKMKMGDLLLKYLEQEQARNRSADRQPPPVPAKDSRCVSPQKPSHGDARSQVPGRTYNGLSDELARDKENDSDIMDRKRRARQAAEAGHVRPVQVLSPTSSNSRLATRDHPPSPSKSQIARLGSPLKSSGTSRTAAVTSVLSSMVERAKATRHGVTRKVTTASEASSRSSGTTTRNRRPAAAPALPKAPPSRPATRAGRRVSGTSEASEGSTGTVVRRVAPGRAAAAPKKTTMGAIRRGVTGAGAKKETAKPAAASTSASGRVLRKRG